ncbi:fimbrial chaperone protein FimC, partial [Salmonella enterica subsp. enterica serovar Enteritidis str. 76-2651]
TLLKFSRVGNHLKITNPSAYYLTLVNISVGAKKIDNVMIAPKKRHANSLTDWRAGQRDISDRQ